MTLQSSGAISKSDINVELTKSSTAVISLNDTDVRSLLQKASGQISMSDAYGKSYAVPPQTLFTSSGTFTVPTGVTSICAVMVGKGGNGSSVDAYNSGGGGGGLRWINNLPVTPGESLTVTLGTNATILRSSNVLCEATGGQNGSTTSNSGGLGGSGTTEGTGPYGGTVGGGTGGTGGTGLINSSAGGGGAAGYTGQGGTGGGTTNPTAGSGGGGGGGASLGQAFHAGGGGGVGLLGQGANGAAGDSNWRGGDGGSGGTDGAQSSAGSGGSYGGGGGSYDGLGGNVTGGPAGLRIIWGAARFFPSQNTQDVSSLNDILYATSVSATNINEGESVTISVSTANVANGTTLYWTTQGSNITSGDFSDATLSGSFTVNSNSANITRTLSNDLSFEGSESFSIQIRTGSTSGTVVATSDSILVNDTSRPSISLSVSSTSINEGQSVTITVTVTGTFPSNTLNWTTNPISGSITSSDFTDSTQSGTVTLTNNVGTITRTLKDDFTADGQEVFNITVSYPSSNISATSANITVNDTSTAPILSLSSSTVTEYDYVDISILGVANTGYYLTVTNTPSNADYYRLVVQDGVAYNTTTRQLGFITTDGSGNASFRLYVIGGTGTFTNYTLNIAARITSYTGTTISNTVTLTVQDGANTTSGDIRSVASNSSTATTGTATLSANLLDNDFYLYHDYATGTVTAGTATPSGWSSGTVSGTTSTSISRVLYKKMLQSEASTSVQMYDGATDRKLGIYFRSDNARLTTATFSIIAQTASTSSGTVTLTLPSSQGVLLGSNEAAILFACGYNSGTSNFTITTLTPFETFWTNTGSAFQRATTLVFRPGTKIPWQVLSSMTLTGTIRRHIFLIKISW